MDTLQAATQKDLSLPELQAFFFASYPDLDQALYLDLFKRLESQEVGEDVARAMLDQIKRRKVALKLSEDASRVAQGTLDIENLREHVDVLFSQRVDHDDLRRVPTSLTEILGTVYREKGLRWSLSCLNKSLGSLRPGDFGFIFARPETGKTTFLAHQGAHFVSHATKPVIWFNNEEQGEKPMVRVYQAFFGVTLDKLMSNIQGYEKAFLERTNGLLQMYDSGSIHRRAVEKIIARENPCLVIYDQLTKIKGFQNDRDDLRLGTIFQWAREQAKGAHAAIGVSQADGSAEGVRYLSMEHVANAKTAVQAEADWILGIGKVHDRALEKVRYLNISKNKLFGDEDSIPDLKHGQFEVLLEAQIARYKDIAEYK